MSLHWYACISTNTYCFETHYILLGTDWWVLSNTSSIVWIHLAFHEILADKDFTATDVLISQSFVILFVHLTYVQIALIWSFLAQLSLWKLVHWLWRYKLNEVCDTNCWKRSSRSLNFSRTSNLSNLSISHPPSHMYKPQNSLIQITPWKLSKSRTPSPP